MTRRPGVFLSGLVLIASGGLALVLATSLMGRSLAQNPVQTPPASSLNPTPSLPSAGLPPPDAGLPPELGAPQSALPGATQGPESSLSSGQPSEAGQQPTLAQPQDLQAPPPSQELPPPSPAELAIDPNAPQPPPAMSPVQMLDPNDPGLKPVNPEGFVYDPTGRRDPFFPSSSLEPLPPPIVEKPETGGTGLSPQDNARMTSRPGAGDPLLSYYLKDYRLIGILWGVENPRAMIKAPDNQIYQIQTRMKMGIENAVVAAIREKEVVFIEPDENGAYKKGTPRILRMRK